MPLNPVDAAFESTLRTCLPETVFRPVEPHYLEEPRGIWQGQAGLILAPYHTEQVATIIRTAHAAHVGVVPYGGGTGLVGGQVMQDGPAPLVLSLERMKAIRSVHQTENLLIAEAGATLAEVQEAAEQANRLFPLSLAAEGSAQIGGNLATNAGGTGVLRYGNARDLCLGLEAVLPDGEIGHGLSRLRKDNTGYDLKNLLIGAEGTLGIITAATLKLSPRPQAVGTALMVVPTPQAAIDLLSLARDQLGDGISAFELIHGAGLEFLAGCLPDIRQPFEEIPSWSVLIELGLSGGLDPQTALEELFTDAHTRDLVSDGLIAQSAGQRQEFWSVREHIPIANKQVGSVSSHDVSIPISRIPAFIAEADARVTALGPYRINCFGHLGDGNLHYNIFPPKGENKSAYADQRANVKQAVHDLVHDYEGSVSAEHGIGRLKTKDLIRYGDPVKLATMQAIKQALDPNGIMNPGAIFST